MSKFRGDETLILRGIVVTLGRFELPTCGLGNRLQPYRTKLHNKE